ncbi:hypothetical protein ACHHYP_20558 [Achlya hypogyna]|uniref:DDE Tnp4 domain-containing protein n=1 Tax=Achlya hypogyna TaxID=1202772 RepID=A0A1V9YIZ9_ACHHY|nr:hypothetical protein ACHHYP_20558 [Achlya hypogyna]
MDAWFVRYLRCSRRVFNKIVARIEAHWVDAHGALHHHTQHDVADRVAVSLFYFTHVDGYDCAGQIFVTIILVKFFFASMVAPPTTASGWHANMEAFETFAGFPNVCCAVDGTLIRIKRFADHEDCRKGFPSFNVQGVVDARKRFLAVSIKAGSQNDRGIFRDSGAVKVHWYRDRAHSLGNNVNARMQTINETIDAAIVIFGARSARWRAISACFCAGEMSSLPSMRWHLDGRSA